MDQSFIKVPAVAIIAFANERLEEIQPAYDAYFHKQIAEEHEESVRETQNPSWFRRWFLSEKIAKTKEEIEQSVNRWMADGARIHWNDTPDGMSDDLTWSLRSLVNRKSETRVRLDRIRELAEGAKSKGSDQFVYMIASDYHFISRKISF